MVEIEEEEEEKEKKEEKEEILYNRYDYGYNHGIIQHERYQ